MRDVHLPSSPVAPHFLHFFIFIFCGVRRNRVTIRTSSGGTFLSGYVKRTNTGEKNLLRPPIRFRSGRVKRTEGTEIRRCHVARHVALHSHISPERKTVWKMRARYGRRTSSPMMMENAASTEDKSWWKFNRSPLSIPSNRTESNRIHIFFYKREKFDIWTLSILSGHWNRINSFQLVTFQK